MARASPRIATVRVIEAANDLFNTGHYDQAVSEAMKSNEIRVRDISGLQLSGAPLMQEAFKPKGGLLDVSTQIVRSGEDEREEFLHLFRGGMLGIRNPRAHDAPKNEDPFATLELLAFASILHRRLDVAAVRRS